MGRNTIMFFSLGSLLSAFRRATAEPENDNSAGSVMDGFKSGVNALYEEKKQTLIAEAEQELRLVENDNEKKSA